MDTKEFTVFYGNKGVTTVRAGKAERSSNLFGSNKSLSADLALELTVTAIVVVYVLMRGTAYRAYGIFGNSPAITALNRSDILLVFPEVVFEKEPIVLLDECFDDWKFVYTEFLILWRVGIFESPLFQRDISADKVKKPADLLMLVLNKLK